MMKRFDKWSPFVLMIAIDFASATVNILLKKVVDEGMSHLVFITYRLTTSTIFLAPIAFFLERNARPKLTLTILFHIFLSAIVGTSLTQYFFLLGIQYTSATFACAFVNTVPVITFIMALPFKLETVGIKSSSGKAKVVGALVCFGGALLLTLYKGMPLFNHPNSTHSMIRLRSGNRKERWTLGSIALLAGTLLWSSWFILQSNVGKRYPCQYSSTAVMTFFGAIQSAILSFLVDRDLTLWFVKGKIELLSFMYAGMVGSGMCFVGLSWCVKKRGPVFTAAFSPLIQIMAAMFEIPILHEQLYLGSLMGSVIVIAGLYILLWGKNKELHNSIMKEEPRLKVIAVVAHDSTSS